MILTDDNFATIAKAIHEAKRDWDSGNEISYLGIWDAARIDKKPVCEIGLKHRIPYGFHGLWRPYRA